MPLQIEERDTHGNNIQTKWRRFFPQKLTFPQLVKKFPAYYGTRRLITGRKKLAITIILTVTKKN
jgi:hypothetical protein